MRCMWFGSFCSSFGSKSVGDGKHVLDECQPEGDSTVEAIRQIGINILNRES